MDRPHCEGIPPAPSTLAELESLTSLRTTWLLTLYDTWVASYETSSTECSLVLRIDLDKRTSDTKTSSLALALEATTSEIDSDVILVSYLKLDERLLDNKLKYRRGEVAGNILLIDCDLA